MHYVYILSSINHDQVYTGFTTNLERRLSEHNAGKGIHTRKYLPWRLETYIAFSTEEMAREFERYLKTGSGIAFMRKRLINRQQI